MKEISEAEWLLTELWLDSHAPVHRLVIDHGSNFDPAPLGSDIKPGAPKCCFRNAAILASQDPLRFVYYEGFATYRFPTAESFERSWPPQMHAWCVEGASRVVDPTWTEQLHLQPLAYRGLALPLKLVEPFAYKLSRGTLQNYARRIDQLYRVLGLAPPTTR